MSKTTLVGKPSPRRLGKLLAGCFGAREPRLIVGPGPGLDAAILGVGRGRVMVVAEDPIFPAPGLPLEIMGEFTVHIGASDVAVTGARPTHMTYTLLLPPTCPERDAAVVIRSISKTAKRLGISIVGGHTGWYGAVTIPIVGGVTVWGFAEKGGWVSPGGARDGDLLLMTKGPAIEASALLAVLYRKRLERLVPRKSLDALCARTREITVVKDALVAFEAGRPVGPLGGKRRASAARGGNGVHAMHDATEGGVLGGLWEMSEASGLRLRADLDAVRVPADIAALAAALRFDPWQAISEGTLLAAVAPRAAARVLDAWRRAGIPGFCIGEFDSTLRRNTLRRGGRTGPLPEPGKDPFWPLFFKGLS